MTLQCCSGLLRSCFTYIVFFQIGSAKTRAGMQLQKIDIAEQREAVEEVIVRQKDIYPKGEISATEGRGKGRAADFPAFHHDKELSIFFSAAITVASCRCNKPRLCLSILSFFDSFLFDQIEDVIIFKKTLKFGWEYSKWTFRNSLQKHLKALHVRYQPLKRAEGVLCTQAGASRISSVPKALDWIHLLFLKVARLALLSSLPYLRRGAETDLLTSCIWSWHRAVPRINGVPDSWIYKMMSDRWGSGAYPRLPVDNRLAGLHNGCACPKCQNARNTRRQKEYP